MRSTRASAAWAALAMTTSLLGVTIVGAQTQTTAATTGIARGVVLPNSRVHALTSDNSLDILKPGASQYGQTTRLLFSIDLSQIDPNLPLGRTQKVVVRRGQPAALPGSNAPITGGVFDIAVVPRP